MKNNKLESIAELLKHERRYNNITLEELSFSANVSYNAVWNAENGCDFKMSTFIKLCNFYNLDISNIFKGKEYKNNLGLNLNKEQIEKLKVFINSLQDK